MSYNDTYLCFAEHRNIKRCTNTIIVCLTTDITGSISSTKINKNRTYSPWNKYLFIDCNAYWLTRHLKSVIEI